MAGLNGYQTMISVLKPNVNPTDEEIEQVNSFFLCRWLSASPKSIFVSNFINRYYNIPKKIQYNFAKQLLAGKIKWLQYPKKEEEKDKVILNISKYYKINLYMAEEYYDMMNKEEKEKFERIYDYGI